MPAWRNSRSHLAGMGGHPVGGRDSFSGGVLATTVAGRRASSRFADGARRSLVSLQTETSQGLTSCVGEAYICTFWAPVPSDLKRSVHDDQSIHVR